MDLGRVNTAGLHLRVARRPHRPVALGDTVPWNCLAANRPSCLARAGHIAGVINPASKNRRNYWTNELLTDEADDWLARADSHTRQLVADTGRSGWRTHAWCTPSGAGTGWQRQESPAGPAPGVLRHRAFRTEQYRRPERCKFCRPPLP